MNLELICCRCGHSNRDEYRPCSFMGTSWKRHDYKNNLEIAAQAWATKETSNIEMNPDLCAAFANILQHFIEAAEDNAMGAKRYRFIRMFRMFAFDNRHLADFELDAAIDARSSEAKAMKIMDENIEKQSANAPNEHRAVREFIRISVIGRGDVPDDIRNGAITVLAAECKEDK